MYYVKARIFAVICVVDSPAVQFREKIRLLDQLKCVASRQQHLPDMYKEVCAIQFVVSHFLTLRGLCNNVPVPVSRSSLFRLCASHLRWKHFDGFTYMLWVQDILHGSRVKVYVENWRQQFYLWLHCIFAMFLSRLLCGIWSAACISTSSLFGLLLRSL